MNQKLLKGLSFAFVLGFCSMNAQVFQAWPIQSGFNADVIANGTGPSASSTTMDVDGVNYNFVSRDFKPTAASPDLTYGLPLTGQFNSAVAATPNLPYQLASYSGNNSLRLAAAGNNGTLTFASPARAYKLYMLSTSGSGTATLDVVVNFTDASSQTFTGVAISDWYNGTNFAIQGFGRVLRTTDVLESGSGTNPRLYQNTLTLDVANQAKLIQSVTLTKTATGTGVANVFGFSADAVVTCAPPSALVASAPTVNSAQIAWTPPTTGTPSSYEVYYNTTNVMPTDATPATLTGVTGTSTTLSSLASNTTYYVWIRSNCGTPGPWGSIGTQFTTLCGIFNAPYTENFDTTSVGSSTNNNAPACWSYLETAGFAGYGYVSSGSSSTTPNSYYLYNSSATTGSHMLVSPQTAGLSDGSKRVRFSARAGTAGYTLQLGTLSNSADANTFTAVGSVISLTTTFAPYTVNIPAGSDAYLAFKHGMGGTFRGIYIDNIIVENIPTCLEPTGLTSSNVQATSADFTWTPSATVPAPVYEIYYAPTGSAAPTAATAPLFTGINLNTFTLAGLTPGTGYCLWVRSSCSSTDKSPWSNSSCFATTPGNDNCATPIQLIPGGSFAQNMQTANNLGATPTSDTSATHSCQATAFNEVWYSVTVPASGNLTIETNSVSGSTVTDTVLSIFTGSCGALTQIGCDDDSSTDGNFSKYSLTGQTPGATLLIAIWNYSNSTAGQFKISAYDSSLGTSEAGTKEQIQLYPNPFSDVLNIRNARELNGITVIDASGRTVKSLKPEVQLHLGDLQAGIYFLKLEFKDGSTKIMKTVKK
ncbi:fibronectin type III domain-containing protein [Chryseobacterium sp.]|uniref:fibronectin type III domain-containing protein n=1 Tax=Chryseobacterium sp. TaxID=1871047 RepID=UPI0011C947DF|nr:fibronectin type III domain-containing protein [Chryseobacterium sp.]TXF74867.1 T9SS type A sorting domain-containing protein [Chryseobacterium sp.]